jgi:hypothetical protein
MFDFTSPPAFVLAMTWREKIAGASWLELVLWIGLALLTLALLVLVGTRWGQVRPVSKCVVLSVFAHLLFLFYAYATSFSFRNGALTGDPFIRVSYLTSDEVDGSESSNQESGPAAMAAGEAPEASAAPEMVPEPLLEKLEKPAELAKPEPAEARAPDFAQLAESPLSTGTPPALLPAPQPPAPMPATESVPDPSADEPGTAATAQELAALPDSPPADDSKTNQSVPEPRAEAETGDSPEIAKSSESSGDVPATSVSKADELTTVATQTPAATVRPIDGQPIPDAYQLRVIPGRLQFAIPWGANENTEAAVVAALKWLATNQATDGRWDASDFGAGRETRTLGQDRRGAGATADSGISALALLAFLGSGHTHVQGQYQETVQRGLEFLMRSQLPDGSLVGEAKDFEKMYCHGIALIALSEAYAMTGDSRLQSAWQRGLQYTLAAQDSVSGGWRYRPGERGDLSQCGWQVMALRSAELGGFTIPTESRRGISKFLDSVKQGTNGGLSSYRPRERVTRTMTAEAMVCRLLLELPAQEAAFQEANDFLLRELPGQDEANLYYWYYATLYLFQLQGDAWEQWNTALQRNLLARQVRDGRLAGSWDTRDTWGGYGGRVYTTAMAALCLEVYYRYLPIYDPANSVRHAETIRDPNAVRR